MKQGGAGRPRITKKKDTQKQESQSRVDGGIELDGSRRPFLAVTSPELPGHHELEKRKANAEGGMLAHVSVARGRQCTSDYKCQCARAWMPE